MRPKRLEVSGFASFREPAEVDFSDADLFVLTGPTGAGKSSLIDAMIFALYGAVPRYGSENLVAPVITQGQREARVRLDFSVAGEGFTAVRVVRRTASGGATTREARLEQGERVLAGNPRELTERVQRLLGLSFRHFVRCAALPQGAFAEFLHATPKERQDLLVELLDLDLYRQMGTAAHQRAKELGAQVTLLTTRLAEDFAGATEDARNEASLRVEQLEELTAAIGQAEPRLAALAHEAEQARAKASEAERRVLLLEAVTVPRKALRLAEELATSREEAAAARKTLQDARETVSRMSQESVELPEPSSLRRAVQLHRGRDEGARAAAAEEEARLEAEVEERGRQEARQAAADQLRLSREHQDAHRRAHAAAELARHLEPGSPCPVCGRELTAPLPLHETPDLDAAERAVAEAEEALRAADESVAEAVQVRTRSVAEADSLRKRLTALDCELQGLPSRDEAEILLPRVEGLLAALGTARQEEVAAFAALEEARNAVEVLEDKQVEAWRTFDVTRDRLAVLEPPAADRSNLAKAWRELAGWAEDRAPIERERAEGLVAEAEVQEGEREALSHDLAKACSSQGVEPGDRSPREAAASALARARSQLADLEAKIERAAELERHRKGLEQDEAVAKELSQLLRSTGFERWYLNRALDRLATGASRILRDLSTGQYSVTVDDGGNFLVVDHANADELRLARTLSGGETFLASLALALALAEHVAHLAARGAARLEAIFLDEGFGTLDAETLDTVASAIESLRARGRMVGLVTHVRDLAERIPVRFEVRKDTRSSRVTRVAL